MSRWLPQPRGTEGGLSLRDKGEGLHWRFEAREEVPDEVPP